MRAAVVSEFGQAPEITGRDVPRRPPGSALVRIAAVSLNPIDLLISSGGHPLGRPPVPHVPGVEGVGTVVESDTHTPGTRVRVSVPGGFVDGTLAEFVVAPDASCLPVPDALGDDLAAAIGVVGVSALIALRDEAGLQAGESVLVFGATGGLGRAVIRLARALGAERIVAAARNEQRLGELADEGGIDGTVVLTTDPAEFASRLDKAGGPVDVVVDSLWGPYAPSALAALRTGGRYVNLGQSAGAEATVNAGLIRHSHLKLTGLSGASLSPEQGAAAYAQVADFAVAGKLDLAIESYALDDVASAWQAQAASPGRKITLRP
jgi:NADPH:quinone reductase-like Zn-dependent oxidoreductase